MANNATITFADFTQMKTLVNSVNSNLTRTNALFNGITVAAGKTYTNSVAANIKDIGVIGVAVQVVFPKGKTSVEFALTGSSGISYPNIASDTNVVILSSVSTPADTRDVNYTVHIDKDLNTPKKLFGTTTNNVGYIVRSKSYDKDLTVDVNILMIAFPNG